MYGLTVENIELIESILYHYPQVDKAILYGSRAMGTFKNGSDIDLTLKGHNLDLDFLARLSNEFDDTDLPYIFDLSIYDHIKNDDLLNHIQRVGIVFYTKEKQIPSAPHIEK